MRIDEQTTTRVVDFHGHMCPGLAMGIRAAEVALAEVGPHSADEEVVAVVETDMCAVDAIQFLTGCTFGKGNLIHLDYGKNAYTFIRRSDGHAVRVSTRPGAFGDDPERAELRAAISSGTATDAQRKQFWELQRARSLDLLEAPIERLYEVRKVDAEVPARARVFRSVPCDACGEPTMPPRIREVEGRQLCPPCAERATAPPATELRWA